MIHWHCAWLIVGGAIAFPAAVLAFGIAGHYLEQWGKRNPAGAIIVALIVLAVVGGIVASLMCRP